MNCQSMFIAVTIASGRLRWLPRLTWLRGRVMRALWAHLSLPRSGHAAASGYRFKIENRLAAGRRFCCRSGAPGPAVPTAQDLPTSRHPYGRRRDVLIIREPLQIHKI